MTTVAAKDVYVTWNGDLSSWPDYVRKVRLQFEKTEPHKRNRLGPELVSRLTFKAWQATLEIDHQRLSRKHGAKYMIQFLLDRLCRAPVPDAGARLEDLLIRLRRQSGTPFAQWSHEVRETYRRLQRALLRARQEMDAKEVGKANLNLDLRLLLVTLHQLVVNEAEIRQSMRRRTRTSSTRLDTTMRPLLRELVILTGGNGMNNGLLPNGANGFVKARRAIAVIGPRPLRMTKKKMILMLMRLGMSWRWKRRRSCLTRSLDGFC